MEKLRKKIFSIAAFGVASLIAVAPLATRAETNFEQTERMARGLQLNGLPPFGGVSEVGALSRAWSVNTFYIVYRGSYPDQRFFWAIRREASDGRRPSAVRWADSRSCPAVEKTLVQMERLPLVRPDAIRLGQETDVLGLGVDGVHHIFWNRYARTGPNDATVNLEIQGNTNSPVALWWAASFPELAGCWTEVQPS